MKTVLPQNTILSKANTVTVDAEKLAKLRTASIHINADWDANDGPAQILHKPTKVTAFENDAGYVTGSDIDGKADKRPPSSAGIRKIGKDAFKGVPNNIVVYVPSFSYCEFLIDSGLPDDATIIVKYGGKRFSTRFSGIDD